MQMSEDTLLNIVAEDFLSDLHTDELDVRKAAEALTLLANILLDNELHDTAQRLLAIAAKLKGIDA